MKSSLENLKTPNGTTATTDEMASKREKHKEYEKEKEKKMKSFLHLSIFVSLFVCLQFALSYITYEKKRAFFFQIQEWRNGNENGQQNTQTIYLGEKIRKYSN